MALEGENLNVSFDKMRKFVKILEIITHLRFTGTLGLTPELLRQLAPWASVQAAPAADAPVADEDVADRGFFAGALASLAKAPPRTENVVKRICCNP